MKYLKWFKQNVNLCSFVVGVICIAAGKAEIGQILIKGVE